MPAPDQFWEFLGSIELVAAGSVTTGSLTIPVRRLLKLQFSVTGMSAVDNPSLRFNGDSGTNYWSRLLSSVAGGAVWANNQNVSQTVARLCAPTTTLQVVGEVTITNSPQSPKVGTVTSQISTGAAATAGGLAFGGFEWVSTIAPISSIELRTAGGVNTFGANTGFIVWGRDF